MIYFTSTGYYCLSEKCDAQLSSYLLLAVDQISHSLPLLTMLRMVISAIQYVIGDRYRVQRKRLLFNQ